MAAFGGDQEEKAQQYIADAEKILKKKWSSLFGGTNKNEDAAECFNNAARCYKVARKMEEAGACYERAGEQYEITKSAPYESAKAYVEAAKCRKSVEPRTAVESFGKAIAIYNESGRFQQAGKMLQEVGEIYEAEGMAEDAVNSLQQASEYLAGEGCVSQANACLVKIAAIVSKDKDKPNLTLAAEIYEKLGRSCMEKKLLAMNAKGYWLQTGLCLLAQGDTVAARNKQSDFTTVDYTFDDSREYRFLDQLIQASEDFNVENFSQHCFDYDQISKLDPWKTNMCLRIKRAIEAGAGHGEEDEEMDLT
ncbi:unnamed protein product [Ectocarpus fasciculatus]